MFLNSDKVKTNAVPKIVFRSNAKNNRNIYKKGEEGVTKYLLGCFSQC